MDKSKQKVINAWSVTRKGESVNPGDIVLLKKDNGKRHFEIVKDFQWYFYVENTPKAQAVLEKMNGNLKGLKIGKEYIKVLYDKKAFREDTILSLIKDLRSKGIETYEADVGPAKRYLIDKKYDIEDFENVNLWYIDIETDDSSGSLEYDDRGIKAKDRILSFAAINKEGKEVFVCKEDEKQLLEAFNQFLNDEHVDMLVGWNSKDFDLPYLWKRMDHHKVKSSYLRNILHEDMMKRVMYFYSKDPEARQNITSYSLNSISNYFLGKGKVERPGKVIDLMKDDFATFKEYNLTDVRLLKELEEKLGLINLTYQMFQMCGTTAQNWSMIKAIDNLILKEASWKGIHYKTNEAYFNEVEPAEEEYLGAFVLDPVPGYYELVYDLDFKSLYPNIIRTFNISPDTISRGIRGMDYISTPGVYIDDKIRGKVEYYKQKGIIPEKITLLLDEREKIRKKQKGLKKDSIEYRDLNVKQLVVKELANSIYGVIGNKFFRGFNLDMAESITGTGQYLIKYLKRTFEEKGRKVIYGDTDSVFVILKDGEKISEVLDETNKEISKHLKKDFGVNDCTIQLDLDKVFDQYYIESKKKYAGKIGEGIKYVGMECVKRDTIPITAEMQKQLINLIFSKKDRADVETWIHDLKERISEEEIDIKNITIYKKMSKDASSYKGKSEKKYTPPIHVRIAQRLKETKADKTDLTKGGTIIPYVITSHDPTLDGVHISEYKGEWDRIHYWNSVIFPPLHRALEVVYPEVDWIKYYIDESKPKKVKDDNERTSASSPRPKRKSDRTDKERSSEQA